MLYILEGVRRTAILTIRTIAAIRALQREVHDDLARVLGVVDADLLAVLFEQPYTHIGLVMERCTVSRPTATNRLKALADAGVLVSVPVGTQLLFMNHRLLDLLRRPGDTSARDTPTRALWSEMTRAGTRRDCGGRRRSVRVWRMS